MLHWALAGFAQWLGRSSLPSPPPSHTRKAPGLDSGQGHPRARASVAGSIRPSLGCGRGSPSLSHRCLSVSPLPSGLSNNQWENVNNNNNKCCLGHRGEEDTDPFALSVSLHRHKAGRAAAVTRPTFPPQVGGRGGGGSSRARAGARPRLRPRPRPLRKGQRHRQHQLLHAMPKEPTQ